MRITYKDLYAASTLVNSNISFVSLFVNKTTLLLAFLPAYNLLFISSESFLPKLALRIASLADSVSIFFTFRVI